MRAWPDCRSVRLDVRCCLSAGSSPAVLEARLAYAQDTAVAGVVMSGRLTVGRWRAEGGTLLGWDL